MAEKITREEAERLASPSPAKDEGFRPEVGLEILGCDPEVLQTSQGPISIEPMKMRQIRSFMVHAERFMPMLQADLRKDSHMNLTKLLNADSDAFMAAVAIGANTTVDLLDNLKPDEFIKVATKVVLVNMDFFVRVLPVALGGAEVSVLSAIQRVVAGVPQSNSSSPTATPSKK